MSDTPLPDMAASYDAFRIVRGVLRPGADGQMDEIELFEDGYIPDPEDANRQKVWCLEGVYRDRPWLPERDGQRLLGYELITSRDDKEEVMSLYAGLTGNLIENADPKSDENILNLPASPPLASNVRLLQTLQLLLETSPDLEDPEPLPDRAMALQRSQQLIDATAEAISTADPDLRIPRIAKWLFRGEFFKARDVHDVISQSEFALSTTGAKRLFEHVLFEGADGVLYTVDVRLAFRPASADCIRDCHEYGEPAAI